MAFHVQILATMQLRADAQLDAFHRAVIVFTIVLCQRRRHRSPSLLKVPNKAIPSQHHSMIHIQQVPTYTNDVSVIDIKRMLRRCFYRNSFIINYVLHRRKIVRD